MNAEVFLHLVDERILTLAGPLTRVLGQPPVALGGGKSVRPRLVHACAETVGLAMETAALWAALVEAIHIASLLHDDVIDDARVRRGQPSLAAREGNRRAVLSGDLLVSAVWLAAAAELPPHVTAILAEAMVAMSDAELRESELFWNPDATAALYLSVVDGKTAALFGAAAEGTAALAGAPVPVRQVLGQSGLAFGRAFQIEDDVRDYTSSPQALGKEPRRDLAQGLVTLPLILALHHGDGRAAMVRRHLGSRGRHGLDPRGLERLLAESHALDRSRRLVRGLVRRGLRRVPRFEGPGWHAPSWPLSA